MRINDYDATLILEAITYIVGKMMPSTIDKNTLTDIVDKYFDEFCENQNITDIISEADC